MQDTETEVEAHYTTGALADRVREAAAAMGADPDHLTADDLKLADEFHTGGVLATEHLFDQLSIAASDHVLDIGCGIGGTSRYVATRFGASVTGFDLTQEFVDTAKALNQAVGLAEKIELRQGSATRMPVADAAFDMAVMLHVGMNIDDKAAVFAEAARALKPGGTFAIFDVMRGQDTTSALRFPLPWATVADTSFVAPQDVYSAAAQGAGFTLVARTDRGQFAQEFVSEALAKAASEGPAPLGIHLMMGDTARVKFENYLSNVESGCITPVEMIFRKET